MSDYTSLCIALLCTVFKAKHATFTLRYYCADCIYILVQGIYVAVAYDNTHTHVGGASRIIVSVPECGIAVGADVSMCIFGQLLRV
jgi:hypothetical protein